MSEKQLEKFGLPAPKGGTAKERAKTRALTVHKGQMVLGFLFRHFSEVLGQHKARQLFAPYAPKPARGKRIDPDRRAHLLYVHDVLQEQIPDPAAVPKIAALGLHAADPGKYGNSAPAIEKQIRRLVNEREAARKLAEDMFKICQVELSNVRSLFTDK